jgi:hypothetical protein
MNILSVPSDTMRLTAFVLSSITNLEACCFWYGTLDSTGVAIVAAVVVPKQQNNKGNYNVTVEAMVEVADAVRHRGWKNLAQVHSHPGAGVRHSRYDDQMANSRRAFSLIFPNYGRLSKTWRFHRWVWRFWPRAFPDEVGVHRFVGGYWEFLRPGAERSSLRLASGPRPELIDLRNAKY